MTEKGNMRLALVVLLLFGLAMAAIALSGCGTPTVTVATTATIGQSPMYQTLIEEFESENEVTVITKEFGSSREALEAGAAGEADALLVSKSAALEEWMKKGYGMSAQDVFYSEFVVVGPDADPAQIRGLDCPGKSCGKIGTAGEAFVTSGDGSDLDTKVMGYWDKCGIDPVGQPWFEKTGQGVKETLAFAGEKQAYTIVDTSTWLANADDVDLKKLVEGCTMLMNQYSFVVIDPNKFPDEKLNLEGAEMLSEFMLGGEAQDMVGAYKEADVVIYHPNATKELDGEDSM
jgi:tungstate transport system substrate-binding protein